MGQMNTFYTAVQTRVAAIVNGTPVAFPRVFITPDINIEKLVASPRWPVAVITPGLDSIASTNGKIRTGEFMITILVHRPRDHVNQVAMLELLDLGDLLITALEFDNDDSITNQSTGEANTVNFDSTVVVGLSFTFRYTIRRS